MMTIYHYRSIPAVFSLVRANLSGFLRGLRYRQPVSERVSQLYREHCVEFANPLRLLRKRPGRQNFWAARPQYYPTAAPASLEIRPGT
jgi:hypothetical protein